MNSGPNTMSYQVRLLALTCVLGGVGSFCNWDVKTQGCPSGGINDETWQCLAEQKNCPYTWLDVASELPMFCLVGEGCNDQPMYHCGKLQNGSWAERCASGVGCRPGYVPVLPDEEYGWATCPIPCRDTDRYSGDRMFTAWNYRCSFAKRSCRADQHMHTCWEGSNMLDRRCTCDVRNGWILETDWGENEAFKYCFPFTDWTCKYSPCEDPTTERLLNWTCAPKCPTNYARLSYEHDDCIYNGPSTTSTTPCPSLKTRTTPAPASKSPPPSTTTPGISTSRESTTIRVSPAKYRATITVTSEEYPESLDSPGVDISTLELTDRLQEAIQKLMDTLPGKIKIRIVSMKRGSLLVTFIIETDGHQTLEAIDNVIHEALTSGNMHGIGVSPEGFSMEQLFEEVVGVCTGDIFGFDRGLVFTVSGAMAATCSIIVVVIYICKLRTVKIALARTGELSEWEWETRHRVVQKDNDSSGSISFQSAQSVLQDEESRPIEDLV